MVAKNFPIKYWSYLILFLKSVAILILLFSIIVNPKTIYFLLGKHEDFSATTKILIYLMEVVFLVMGVLLLLFLKFYIQKCSNQIKEISFNILLLLSTLLLLIIFLEFFIRQVAPQKTLDEIKSSNPKILVTGDYLPWQFKPNASGVMSTGEFNVTYEINSLGLRDKERNLTKAPCVTRVLVLGDSFTEGFGVDQNETYSSILEKILNKENISIEVWNAGVLAYSPDIEYLYLKNNIVKINPDIVLLGFYAGNDISDLSQNSWEIDESGLPTKIMSKLLQVEGGQLRIRNKNSNYYLFSSKEALNIFFFRWSHLYILLKKIFVGVGQERIDELPVFYKNWSNKIIYNWEKIELLLTSMKNLSEKNNATFQIVHIPSRLQINPKEWGYIERKFGSNNLKRDAIQEKILAWCKQTNTPCINLLPYFLTSKEELYHILTDMHLSPQGHFLTAEIISKEIILDKKC